MKIITKISLMASCLFLGLSAMNSAEARLAVEGFLPPYESLFWNAFSNLDRPDDYSECMSLVSSCGDEQAAQDVEMLCSDFAKIPQTIYNDMESDGMLEEGMETTNLLNKPDWHNIENLTFESDLGKIEFTGTVDFMSYDFMRFILEFPERIQMRPGYIKFDPGMIGELKDRGATITMKKVPEFQSPTILVDGEKDDEGVVSALQYDKDRRTITFNAAHFTAFQAINGTNYIPEIDNASARQFISKHGKKRVRLSVYGHSFDKDVELKFGSVDPYKTRRYIEKGQDKVVGFFDYHDLLNRGHRKLEVHVTNPKTNGDFTVTHDEEIEIEELDMLKQWKYQKVYHDIVDYMKAIALAFS